MTVFRMVAFGLMVLALATPSLTVADSVVRYVKPGGSDTSGDGLDWSTAYASPERAIDDLTSGGTVQIAEGEYMLKGTLDLGAGVVLKGAGRDKTILNGGQLDVALDTTAAILVTSDAAGVESLTVTNVSKGQSFGACVNISKGRINDCRMTAGMISGGAVSFYGGAGVYQTGGVVTNCLIDHCSCTKLRDIGAGATVAGGELVDCEIRENVAYSQMHQDNGGGAGVWVKDKGWVHHCRIHHNGDATLYQTGAGVRLTSKNAKVENCLIYANMSSGTLPAALYATAGAVKFCTIYGNGTAGGRGVIWLNGAAAANIVFQDNIVYDNEPAGGTLGDFEVKLAMITDNLFKTELGGYANNFTGDPKFTDAANYDFHLSSRASAAYGRVAPDTAIPTDLDGVVRQNPTAVGAFEYVAGAEPFSVTIKVAKHDCLKDVTIPTAEAILPEGVDAETCTIKWYLDGVEAGDGAFVTFPTAGYGRHALAVVATHGVDGSDEDSVEDAFAVLGSTVYVNGSGTGTYPYATVETATNEVAEAIKALYLAADVTSRVEIAEGRYALGQNLNLTGKVVLEGAGAAKTTVVCPDAGRAIVLRNEAAQVKDLTLTDAGGGALEIVQGTVCRCIVTNSTLDAMSELGGGVKMSGGQMFDSTVVDCWITGTSTRGGGVGIMGGLFSNCTVRACRPAYNPYATVGGSVYIEDGMMTHTCVTECGVEAELDSRYFAPALHQAGGIVRNCEFSFCRSVVPDGPAVKVEKGTFESCTVASNAVDGAAVALCKTTSAHGQVANPIALINDIVACNAAAAGVTVENENTTIMYCCYPEATDGADGNISVSPKFRSAGRGDFRLKAGSPCAGKGSVMDWMAGACDLQGRPRLSHGKVSMGAYEPFWSGLMLIFR